MPRGDRTGPQGMGPRTGRAAGYCEGYDAPGCDNSGPGRGYGRGTGGGRGGGGRGRRRGGGRGQGYAWQAPPAPEYGAASAPPAAPADERSFLEQQMAGLKAQVAYLEERLKALAQTSESEKQR